jgi:hypothetical protein
LNPDGVIAVHISNRYLDLKLGERLGIAGAQRKGIGSARNRIAPGAAQGGAADCSLDGRLQQPVSASEMKMRSPQGSPDRIRSDRVAALRSRIAALRSPSRISSCARCGTARCQSAVPWAIRVRVRR